MIGWKPEASDQSFSTVTKYGYRYGTSMGLLMQNSINTCSWPLGSHKVKARSHYYSLITTNPSLGYFGSSDVSKRSCWNFLLNLVPQVNLIYCQASTPSSNLVKALYIFVPLCQLKNPRAKSSSESNGTLLCCRTVGDSSSAPSTALVCGNMDGAYNGDSGSSVVLA